MANTTTKAIPLTKAALTAAEQKARTFGPPGEKKGDICLKGLVRREVIRAAVATLSDKEQDALVAASNEELHRWIGGVLKHAGCLLETVEGYLSIVNELGAIDSHAPSVWGPESIRNHVKALRKPAKTEETKKPAKKPSTKGKTPEAKKTPPKKGKGKPPAKAETESK